MFELVPATEAHAREIATNLSPQSWIDSAVLELDPLALALAGVQKSVYAFAGLDNGRCFCMFGIVPDSLTATSGQPWLLTSADLPKDRAAMARASRQYLPYVRNRFTHLYGFVYEHNAVSIKWLKWLGYTLAPEPEIVGAGKRYYAFEWRSS